MKVDILTPTSAPIERRSTTTTTRELGLVMRLVLKARENSTPMLYISLHHRLRRHKDRSLGAPETRLSGRRITTLAAVGIRLTALLGDDMWCKGTAPRRLPNLARKYLTRDPAQIRDTVAEKCRAVGERKGMVEGDWKFSEKNQDRRTGERLAEESVEAQRRRRKRSASQQRRCSRCAYETYTPFIEGLRRLAILSLPLDRPRNSRAARRDLPANPMKKPTSTRRFSGGVESPSFFYWSPPSFLCSGQLTQLWDTLSSEQRQRQRPDHSQRAQSPIPRTFGPPSPALPKLEHSVEGSSPYRFFWSCSLPLEQTPFSSSRPLLLRISSSPYRLPFGRRRTRLRSMARSKKSNSPRQSDGGVGEPVVCGDQTPRPSATGNKPACSSSSTSSSISSSPSSFFV